MKSNLCHIVLIAGLAGCSHSGTNAAARRVEATPATCYRPNVGPFVDPLPPGMTVEEGLAKGLIGSLEKKEIRRVIRKDLSEVRACYERALAHRPGLTGRVAIQFVITGGGAVSDSRLYSSSLESPETEACIAERACAWQFPATNSGGPVIVTYPFNLTTGTVTES